MIALTELTAYWSKVEFPSTFAESELADLEFITNYVEIVKGVDEFDQLRFLDLHGNEIVRLEKTGVNTMEPGELQNKISRSYFLRGFTLKKGQVYVSPIDLNKEYGKIEVPHKPVLRGVTPIFDALDRQVGIAVINFNLNKVFELMKSRVLEDNFYLLDGYHKVITTNLSKNILPHQAQMSGLDSTIQKNLESKIPLLEKDTFLLDKGSLWVYDKINTDINGALKMMGSSESIDLVSENDWAIILEIPPSYLNQRLESVDNNTLIFNLMTFLLIMLIAYVYVRKQKERNKFIMRLKHKKKALQKSQHQIEKTNKLLKISNQKLQVKNKQLEEFNYVVAHNLKAPVASMSMIVEMLGKSKNGKTDKELFPKLESVTSNITTLTEDVQTYIDILDSSELAAEHVNLILLLKEIENEMVEAGLFQNNKNFRTIHVLDAWHSLKCSRVYIKSILYNLMSNALKYRRENVASHVIFESAWEKDKKVLYVKDNGLGIDLNRHRENVFKMYKRFHRNLSEKGMGLFIVKLQLEAMNATIDVESQEGVGTTFKIKFHSL